MNNKKSKTITEKTQLIIIDDSAAYKVLSKEFSDFTIFHSRNYSPKKDKIKDIASDLEYIKPYDIALQFIPETGIYNLKLNIKFMKDIVFKIGDIYALQKLKLQLSEAIEKHRISDKTFDKKFK